MMFKQRLLKTIVYNTMLIYLQKISRKIIQIRFDWGKQGEGTLVLSIPMTFMMRPRVSGPTGILMGEPVSKTGWPRIKPSVPSIAMVRTVFSPKIKSSQYMGITNSFD